MAPINLLPPKRPRFRYVEAAATAHTGPKSDGQQEQPATPSAPTHILNSDLTSESNIAHSPPTALVRTVSTVTTLDATALESSSTKPSETSKDLEQSSEAVSDMPRRRNRRKASNTDDEHVLVFRARGSPANKIVNGDKLNTNTSARALGDAAERKPRKSTRNTKVPGPDANAADWPVHPTAPKVEGGKKATAWQAEPVATGWQVSDCVAPSKNSWASKPGPFAWNSPDQKPFPNNALGNPASQTFKNDTHFKREVQTANHEQQNARNRKHSKNQDRSNTAFKGQRQPPRNSTWIKHSDIPKGDPNRHKSRWTSPTRSSTMDSNRASSGWGTRKKRAGEGDGAMLADWSGGIIPATCDWDSRPPFRDHQSAAKIEGWLDDVTSQLKDAEPIRFPDGADIFTFTITDSGTRELHASMRGDVVPRYWLPARLNGYQPDLFWVGHIGAEQPKPVDADDLAHAVPWWKTYQEEDCSMLKPMKHPKITRVDPDENEAQRLARENDNGGDNAAENRKATEKAKRLANRKRTLAKREKAHKFSGSYGNGAKSEMPDPIKPGLKIFLRTATKDDMVALRDIYNRYIDNAFVVLETNRRTEDDMLDLWYKIKDAKLPFFVACQRGEKIKSRSKRYNAEDVVMSDRVVGFAYASDMHNKDSIFNSTVQMDVFVHMEYYMQKIGDCLVDKMMGLLDPKFVERGGYTADGAELEDGGLYRKVSNILVHYTYDAEKTDKFNWVSGWLRKRFGLEKVADLQGVAQKFDKQLNLAIFQKKFTLAAAPNAA